MRPPPSRMTFCALMSRCRRPAPCTAASAAQTSRPTSRGFARAERPLRWTISRASRRARARSTGRRGRRAPRRRRPGRRARGAGVPAAGPRSSAVACLAIGHHTFACRALSLETVVVEQLQRDVAMELSVPRAMNVARGALADDLEQDEAPPPLAVGRSDLRLSCRRVRSRGCCGAARRCFRRGGGDGRCGVRGPEHDLQPRPNRWAAVRYRCSEVRERAIVSPQRAMFPDAHAHSDRG